MATDSEGEPDLIQPHSLEMPEVGAPLLHVGFKTRGHDHMRAGANCCISGCCIHTAGRAKISGHAGPGSRGCAGPRAAVCQHVHGGRSRRDGHAELGCPRLPGPLFVPQGFSWRV